MLNIRSNGLLQLVDSLTHHNTDSSDIFMSAYTKEKSLLVSTALERIKDRKRDEDVFRCYC